MVRAAGMMALRFNTERQKHPEVMQITMQLRAKYHKPVSKKMFRHQLGFNCRSPTVLISTGTASSAKEQEDQAGDNQI